VARKTSGEEDRVSSLSDAISLRFNKRFSPRFDCLICNFVANCPWERTDHEQNLHSMCNQCYDKYDLWEELKEHVRRMSYGPMTCGRLCESCGNHGDIFPNDREYETHLRDSHECTTCDKHFETASKLVHASTSELVVD
jgi:hypothetical protein